MPLVTLCIVLRAVFPLGPCLQHFQAGITSKGAQAIGINAPAINRITMLITGGGRDQTKEAVHLQGSRDLADGKPEELGMLESLAGNYNIRACCLDFSPAIRIAQDKINILTRSHVDAQVMPGRPIKERPITSIKILATQVKYAQRLLFSGAQILLHELPHFIEGTWMHGPTQSLGARGCNPPLQRIYPTNAGGIGLLGNRLELVRQVQGNRVAINYSRAVTVTLEASDQATRARRSIAHPLIDTVPNGMLAGLTS